MNGGDDPGKYAAADSAASYSSRALRISFVGDISLNDGYRSLARDHAEPFKDVQDELRRSDLVVGNLECLLEGECGENVLKHPRLKTDVDTLAYLTAAHIGLVSLANNHVYDNLVDGFNKTSRFLQARGIRFVGAGVSVQEAARPLCVNVKGRRLTFLASVSRDTNPHLPPEAEVKVNWLDKERLIEDIKQWRRGSDYIILLLHWGGRFESGMYPDVEQIATAHALIDAGADVIVGHHSHTLQPFEVYHGKHVFYSLGNCCFADIICDDQRYDMSLRRTTESVIVHGVFDDPPYIGYSFTPFWIDRLFLRKNRAVLRRWRRRSRVFAVLKNFRSMWRVYAIKYEYVDPVIDYLRDARSGSLAHKLRRVSVGKVWRHFVRR